MMNTTQEVAVSTWSADPAHSSVQFKVRHMAISWVRGEFRILNGTLSLNEEEITESRIDINIDSGSVNSNEPQRDEHLRNADFLDVEHFPLMHYHSTRVVRGPGDVLVVLGDLTIHGVTRQTELRITELSPATPDPWGNIRMAASATATIDRKDFGLRWNNILETGGLLVGNEIFVDLDVEFVKTTNS